MPLRIKLPKYCQQFTDRHGKRRIYFRRNGNSTALPLDHRSAEFDAAYAFALASSVGLKAGSLTAGKPASSRSKSLAKRTMKELIAAYRKHTDFTQLAASTRQTYGRLIDRIETNMGGVVVAALDSVMLRDSIASRGQTGGVEAGNNWRRIFRTLMQFAVDHGFRPDNPMLNVSKLKRPKNAKRGFRTWTDDDIAKFIVEHPFGTREYLALMLLLYTGQRRSDVVKLGPSSIDGYDPTDFSGREITLTQKKTGKALRLPIVQPLAEALKHAAVQADAPAFLMTRRGVPFTPESFTGQFTDWAKDSGIEGQCSPHGLRKATARRLAEAGCSVKLIASITGHTTLKEIENYTSAADQHAMSKLAMQRLVPALPSPDHQS